MPYVCSVCNYTVDYKKDILKHLNKKKKCYDGDARPEILEINSEIVCELCNKQMANENSLIRHFYTCSKKHERSHMEVLEKKIDELSKLINTSKNVDHIDQQNIITTNNIKTNINNINITLSLTPYNDPNMEGIQPYFDLAIKKLFLSVPSLIENIHFNNKYPENKNICISNKRAKDAKVFDGKKWKTINKQFLLHEMLTTYERELINYAEEKGNNKYIKNYEAVKKNDNATNDLIDEVHNVIYDNSEKVNIKIKEVQKQIKITNSFKATSSPSSLQTSLPLLPPLPPSKNN